MSNWKKIPLRAGNEKWILRGETGKAHRLPLCILLECVEGDWFVTVDVEQLYGVSFVSVGTKDLEVAKIRALEIVQDAYTARTIADNAHRYELDDLIEFEKNCQLYEAP
jgi:hypothetical protein